MVQDRYTTEIVASEMQMLDSRGGQQGGGYDQSQGRISSQRPRPAAERTSNSRVRSASSRAHLSSRAAPLTTIFRSRSDRLKKFWAAPGFTAGV